MGERASSLVAVRASPGGAEVLSGLAAGLPEGLDTAVAVVLHLPAGAESRLQRILDRACPLRASQTRDGEPLERGRIRRWRPSSSPAPAATFGMPGAVILAGGVDEVPPLDGIGTAVIEWAALA